MKLFRENMRIACKLAQCLHARSRKIAYYCIEVRAEFSKNYDLTWLLAPPVTVHKAYCTESRAFLVLLAKIRSELYTKTCDLLRSCAKRRDHTQTHEFVRDLSRRTRSRSNAENVFTREYCCKTLKSERAETSLSVVFFDKLFIRNCSRLVTSCTFNCASGI